MLKRFRFSLGRARAGLGQISWKLYELTFQKFESINDHLWFLIFGISFVENAQENISNMKWRFNI